MIRQAELHLFIGMTGKANFRVPFGIYNGTLAAAIIYVYGPGAVACFTTFSTGGIIFNKNSSVSGKFVFLILLIMAGGASIYAYILGLA